MQFFITRFLLLPENQRCLTPSHHGHRPGLRFSASSPLPQPISPVFRKIFYCWLSYFIVTFKWEYIWKQLANCKEFYNELKLVLIIWAVENFWISCALEILNGFSLSTWSRGWWEIGEVTQLLKICLPVYGKKKEFLLICRKYWYFGKKKPKWALVWDRRASLRSPPSPVGRLRQGQAGTCLFWLFVLETASEKCFGTIYPSDLRLDQQAAAAFRFEWELPHHLPVYLEGSAATAVWSLLFWRVGLGRSDCCSDVQFYSALVISEQISIMS